MRRRAKRRCNLGARLIETAGASSVIRHRLLCSAGGEDGHRAYRDHSCHAAYLRLAIEHFNRRDHVRISQPGEQTTEYSQSPSPQLVVREAERDVARPAWPSGKDSFRNIYVTA